MHQRSEEKKLQKFGFSGNHVLELSCGNADEMTLI